MPVIRGIYQPALSDDGIKNAPFREKKIFLSFKIEEATRFIENVSIIVLNICRDWQRLTLTLSLQLLINHSLIQFTTTCNTVRYQQMIRTNSKILKF